MGFLDDVIDDALNGGIDQDLDGDIDEYDREITFEEESINAEKARREDEYYDMTDDIDDNEDYDCFDDSDEDDL